MRMSVLFQRLEAATLGITMLTAYSLRHYNWLEFVVIFIAIDLSMIGYLHSKHSGAISYNIGHSLILPLLISADSDMVYGKFLPPISIIWLAHIAIDRALCYGPKNIAGFHATILGKLDHNRWQRSQLSYIPGTHDL